MHLLKLKVVCALMLLLSAYPTAYSAHAKVIAPPAPVAPKVILDGTMMKFDVDPIIIKGTTLVPMRAIFEALGADITIWNPITQTVTAARNQREIIYTIGATYAIINGWKVDNKSTVPGMTKDYRTLVPLRMVSESLDAQVNYDGTTKTITIESKKPSSESDESASSLSRYRMTLPYTTILQDAPYAISFLRENHTPDSYVFVGDSITYGSYLGRKETHPYLIAAATGRNSFNLGVPGFSLNQMVPFMKYALQGVEEPDIVVQLEYFWGDSSIEQYSGLEKVLEGSVPEYSDALGYYRDDIVHDDDVTTSRPYANYLDQPAILRDATIARSKQVFSPKTVLGEKLSSRLSELSTFIASRPNQKFFIYVSPYLTSEIYKHTKITPEQFNTYMDQIQDSFSDNPNVRFKDFNSTPDQWAATEYIDWIHRSVSGEKRFAKLMQAWLVEG